IPEFLYHPYGVYTAYPPSKAALAEPSCHSPFISRIRTPAMRVQRQSGRERPAGKRAINHDLHADITLVLRKRESHHRKHGPGSKIGNRHHTGLRNDSASRKIGIVTRDKLHVDASSILAIFSD